MLARHVKVNIVHVEHKFCHVFLHVSVDPILGDVSWTSSMYFLDIFLRFFEHDKKHGFLIV